MVVFLDKKYHKLLLNKGFIALIILTFNQLIAIAQPTKLLKSDLTGKWVLINQAQKSYILHDTIDFQPKKLFETTIVSKTLNSGKWTLNGKKIRLKSCLHSNDNPYKCRDYKWIWIIEVFQANKLIVRQVGEDFQIEYKKIE